MSIFTSGTQARDGRTVNHDRAPWHCRLHDARGTETQCEILWPVHDRHHDPRPEFAVLDNPILAEVRDIQAQPWHTKSGDWEKGFYARFLRYVNDSTANSDGDPLWTEEHRTHARRVLSKLVALS